MPSFGTERRFSISGLSLNITSKLFSISSPTNNYSMGSRTSAATTLHMKSEPCSIHCPVSITNIGIYVAA